MKCAARREEGNGHVYVDNGDDIAVVAADLLVFCYVDISYILCISADSEIDFSHSTTLHTYHQKHPLMLYHTVVVHSAYGDFIT